ncbi:MAG: radical SAM family heme chaperone HemW [Prochloraceae cyanobacterium]
MSEIDDRLFASSAYVHVPFCRRRCYYCDFPITVVGDRPGIGIYNWMAEYTEAVCTEITATVGSRKSLKTVFFGGGTPSILPLKELAKIISSLDKNFGIDRDAEISIEIDPGTFDLEMLRGYRSLGVNRVSLGVQSFDAELLKVCGRSHSLNDIFVAVNLINKAAFDNFSLDLISGLPYQSIEIWEHSLKEAIALTPKHISCYDLVLEPVTAFGRKYREDKKPLPPQGIAAKMYRKAREILVSNGYEHYEISNYAKPGFQCAHNRVYWENKLYYGFGMGAASYVNKQRLTRPRTRKEYYAWVENLIANNGAIEHPVDTKEDLILDTLMLGLRLADGINIAAIEQEFGKDVVAEIWSCLRVYCDRGLIEAISKDGKIVATDRVKDLLEVARLRLSDPEGFLISNTILTDLFARFS